MQRFDLRKLNDAGIDRRIILKWMLKKWSGRV
jgi:hypothetical protein